MARRNVARTAIEGGRRGTCREAEDQEDRRERRAYRDYCRQATLDPELDEPGDWKMHHETGRSYRDFADKLNPVHRWLSSNVGRPWDKVFAEICETFDKKTLAGRHIVGHIEGWVNVHREAPKYYRQAIYDRPWEPGMSNQDRKVVRYEWVRTSFWDFEIDGNGNLVCGDRHPWRKHRDC